jgi:hypothetical protein
MLMLVDRRCTSFVVLLRWGVTELVDFMADGFRGEFWMLDSWFYSW